MCDASSSDNCDCRLSSDDFCADCDIDARSKKTLYTIESLEPDDESTRSRERAMSSDGGSERSARSLARAPSAGGRAAADAVDERPKNASTRTLEDAFDIDAIRQLSVETRNEIESMTRTLSSLFDGRSLDPESAYADLLNIQKNIDCLKTSTQANLHHLILQRQVLRLRAKGEPSESLMRTIDRRVREAAERDGSIAERVARKKSDIRCKLERIDVLDDELSSMDEAIRDIQTHYDVVVTELGQRCLALRNRLLSLEKLGASLDRRSDDDVAAETRFESELDALLRRRIELLARTDLSEEERAALLAALDAEIDATKAAAASHAAAERFRRSAGRTLKRRSSIDVVALERHFAERADRHAGRQRSFETDRARSDDSRERMQLDVKIGYHAAQRAQQLEYLDALKTACDNLEDYGRRIDGLEASKRQAGDDDDDGVRRLDVAIDECFEKAALDDATLDELYEIYRRQVAEDAALADLSPTDSMARYPKSFRSRSMSMVTVKSRGMTDSSTESFVSTADTKYLKQTVGAPLTLALAEIVARQPEDPVHYLAHRLIKFRYDQEVTKIEKQELAELTETRARIAAETLHRNAEREAYEALLELVYTAKEIADRRAYERYLADIAEEEEEGDGFYYGDEAEPSYGEDKFDGV